MTRNNETTSRMRVMGQGVRPLKPLNLEMFTIDVRLNWGGLGDNIARVPAILHVLNNFPWVRLRIYSPNYFLRVLKTLLSHNTNSPHYEVYSIDDLNNTNSPRSPIFVDFRPDTYSSFATNLTHFAWNKLVNQQPPTKIQYPSLPQLPRDPRQPLNRYIVLTPNYTSESRRWPVGEINELIHQCKAQDVDVVLLGQESTKVDTNNAIESEAPLLFASAHVHNLRDSTTLLEAASLIQNAEAICGVDNGLLHLAGCTTTPIIRGMTSVAPKHRRIHRQNRGPIDICPVFASVPCRFCQSNFPHILHHSFKDCLYGDFQCTKQMTAEKFAVQLKKVGVFT